MLPKVIGNYGGPYVDAKPVQNPTTQMAASKANRLMEDAAQLTLTGIRAMVTFTTADGAVAPAVVTHWSLWGNSNAQKPTVTRTTTGKYTITYAASFDDALGTTESLALTQAMVSLGTGSPGANIYVNAVTSHAVEVWIYDSTQTLSDLGGINVTMWVR